MTSPEVVFLPDDVYPHNTNLQSHYLQANNQNQISDLTTA